MNSHLLPDGNNNTWFPVATIELRNFLLMGLTWSSAFPELWKLSQLCKFLLPQTVGNCNPRSQQTMNIKQSHRCLFLLSKVY